MAVGADLRAGTDRRPGVDHAAGADVRADIDEARHQHHIATQMRAAPHERTRNHAHAKCAERIGIEVLESRRHLVPVGRGVGVLHAVFADAKIQQHRFLQPLVDAPAPVLRLGNAQCTRFHLRDRLLDRRTQAGVDLVRAQRRTPLPCALDDLLQRCTHDPSPSMRKTNASRNACCAVSSSAWSFASLITKKSSARSPNVAIRASCTRKR